MADTYIPTAGIHIEDLPTTDTAKTTDGLIINSNNNTVNQISLGDLLADTDAKIQANTDLIDSLSNGAGGLAFTSFSGNILDYVDANCTEPGLYLLYCSSSEDMPTTGSYICLAMVASVNNAVIYAIRPGSTQYNYQNNRLNRTWQGWYRYTGTAVS